MILNIMFFCFVCSFGSVIFKFLFCLAEIFRDAVKVLN